nr:hypothetical protein CFP56_26103 [Quercus suber]
MLEEKKEEQAMERVLASVELVPSGEGGVAPILCLLVAIPSSDSGFSLTNSKRMRLLQIEHVSLVSHRPTVVRSADPDVDAGGRRGSEMDGWTGSPGRC